MHWRYSSRFAQLAFFHAEHRLKAWHLRPLQVIVYALIAFLYLPVAVVVIFAFNGGSNLSWPIQGLSLRWFYLIFNDLSFRNAFLASVEASLIVAILSVAISTAAAMLFTRRPSRASRALQVLSLLPAMMPPLFIAVSLFTAMAYLDIKPGMPMIVLGQLVVTLPFVLAVINARLQRFDTDLEAAARDLGAGPVQTLRRITFPIMLPVLVGAALLAFAFSFDEVLITNFTSGMMATLPLYTYSRLHRSIDPSINAVATLLLVTPWLALALAMPFVGLGRGLTSRLTAKGPLK
jgi:spermidine/putrescine transport system permease protein